MKWLRSSQDLDNIDVKNGTTVLMQCPKTGIVNIMKFFKITRRLYVLETKNSHSVKRFRGDTCGSIAWFMEDMRNELDGNEYNIS